MKRELKRLTAGLLAVLTVFMSLFSNGTTAFAASPSANISFWYATAGKTGGVSELDGGHHSGRILYAVIDGHAGYCMNYGLSASGGQLMTSSDSHRTSLSAKQEKLLSYCMYFGHESNASSEPSDDMKNEYVATQALVWIIVADIFGTSSGDSAASKICGAAPGASSSYAYYEKLRDNIQNAYDATRPSFSSKTKSSAPTYELKWNEANGRFETTLKDTNKVLSDFDFSISGYKTETNGNSLTIYRNSVSTDETLGSASSKSGRVETTSSCVFWLTGNAGDQEFISEKPSADPVYAYIKVKTENIGYGDLTKIDTSTGNKLKKAVYGIYSDKACTDLVDKITTDGNGYVKSKELVAGTYYVKEITAPYGYLKNDKVQKLVVKAGQTTSITADDEIVIGSISIAKVDSETGKAVPQGDASLQGAVYGLYAKSDIVHPDGSTGVIYKKNDKVATLTTDKNGTASVGDLYLGEYYIKEITPSEGYLLDDTKYDVTLDYQGDAVAHVEKDVTVKEQVIKQPFQLIKVSDNGEDTEAPLLEGAGFTAYLKSRLSVNADGSYDFSSAAPVVIGANGETTLYTDAKGHLVSIPIPYGTYVVTESVTPHNMTTIKPFEVKITENNPKEPQVWRVFLDREFTAKLRVVKKDSDTKQSVLVAGATFKIYDYTRKEYVTQYTTYPSKVKHTTFATDEDGDLILPQKLKVGKYRIEEVAAPEGYVVNETFVDVLVDSDTAYEMDSETDDIIIEAEYVNTPVKGKLTVEKRGEVLAGYQGGLLASDDEKQFVYEERGLAGAKYEVYAAEDIFTCDMQKDENGNRTKYYSEGDLIGTITTGEDGKGELSDLPLGRYKVVEVEAPNGYVLDTKEQYVTFVYVDDHTPVVEEAVTFVNDRQKLSLSVLKKDAEEDTPIKGAVFGLYADSGIVSADGEVIVEKGELLETAVSDEKGIVSFVKDYPFAVYTAKEIERPAGYITNDTVITFDTEYQGQDKAVAEYESEFINTPTTFEFTKEDITSGAELSGATLSVIDKDGNVIDSWTSDKEEAHVIKRLAVGETYILREEFAPYGYLKATDVEFTVEDTDEIQSVVMKDEVPTGTIIVNKDGEFVTDIKEVKGHWYDMIFNFFKKPMAGITFDVFAAEDIVSPDGLDTIYYHKDNKVDTIVTDDKGYAALENLPLGRYYLVETKTIEGFVLLEDPIEADVTYVDQDTPIVYAGMDITNERVRVEIEITKKDATNDEALEGATFGLFAKEDIKNAEGKTLVKADDEIEEAVSGKDGKVKFVSDLPLGKYYVKEMKAPAGYVKSDEVFDIDASYKDDKTPVLKFEAEFTNDVTKLEVSKTDITGEKELPGATLTILDKDGNVYDTWVSTEEAHYIEKIPVGEYTLREEAAPEGYKIANEIKFIVEETAEIQKVTMVDEPDEKLTQTGDNFPAVPMAAGGVSLALIGAYALYRMRKKKGNGGK